MYIVFITILFMPATLGQETKAESDTLVVLWTSSDIEVAEKIVYPPARKIRSLQEWDIRA